MTNGNILITGASTGIGAACARKFIAEGFVVYGSVRKSTDAERLAEELGEAFRPVSYTHLVIGRDHLDCGSVASPNRETEGMKDGTDAVSDWPLLNLMSNATGGATWISFHHGGGVGMGYSQHAGMVVLADGTERAERCLKRVLHNDPAMGIFRHHDAGYEKASQFADDFDLNVWK